MDNIGRYGEKLGSLMVFPSVSIFQKIAKENLQRRNLFHMSWTKGNLYLSTKILGYGSIASGVDWIIV